MTVAQRLYLLIGAAVLGLLTVAGVGIYQLDRTYTAANYAAINTVPSYQQLRVIDAAMTGLRISVWVHMSSPDATSMKDAEQNILDSKKKLDAAIDRYLKDACVGVSCLSDDHEKALMDNLRAAIDAYNITINRIIELSTNGKKAEALAYAKTDAASAAAKVAQAVDTEYEYNATLAKKGTEDSAAAKGTAMTMSIVITILTILTLVALGYTILRNLMRQLGGEPARATEIANKIAIGDLTTKIDLAAGDTSSLMAAMQHVTTALKSLMADIEALAIASAEGRLDQRGDANKHQGDYGKLMQGINKTLDAILIPIGEGNRVLRLIRGGNLRERVEIECKGDHEKMKQAVNGVHGWLTDLVAYVTKISNGDLTATMDKASDQDQIHEYLVMLKKNIQALVDDANLLSKAAVEGKLATRADATKHQGDYRKIVEGVNGTLDAVIGPLNVAAGYVDRISKGDLPPKITDNYNGDFNAIKNNLNQAIDAISSMVAEAANLEKAAIEGRLATRADASKYQGDYRKVVVGVNNCLDAVIGPLNVAAGYVDRISKGDIPPKITDTYNGDFNTIKNNLNTCIDAINALIADAGMLSEAAVALKLDTRADATKHQGDYRKIVEGVNATLDAVITPLNA
ncbi:MAG TPA: MCP four helix bundle domain-containing protein, partial [Rhodocyclaceae bacterium]|nr:MCP four helix bundle domain-containing protein [Rhodocyclaceae bacterium]